MFLVQDRMDWQRLFSRQTLRYPGSCPQRLHFSTRSSRWLSRRKRAEEGADWHLAALAWKCPCCFSSESYHTPQTGCREGFRALVAFSGGLVLLSQRSRAVWWLDGVHTPTQPRCVAAGWGAHANPVLLHHVLFLQPWMLVSASVLVFSSVKWV